MGSIHGRGGQVILQGPGWGPSIVSEARAWKFEVDVDFIQTPTFASAWKSTIPTFFSWSGTVEANLDTAQDLLGLVLSTMIAPTSGVAGFTHGTVYLYPDRTTTTRYYAGTCWFKLSADVRVQNVERCGVDLIGDGALANY